MRAVWIWMSFFLLMSAPLWAAKGASFSPSLDGEEVVIKGEVVEINHPILVIEDANGKRYLVRLGPYWFWKKKGYHLKPGTKVKVIGFKQGKFVFPRLIRKDHQVLRFRDQRGFPLWRPQR